MAIGLLAIAFFFGGRGPLKALYLGFRSGLDVGLDVTNWLRLRPRNNNTRAVISRRFYSVFKHIQDWRDPDTGQGYDKVIFVAHSQGTVICADVLRFIHQENGTKPGPELYLLTFGSPLKQLYAQRFPCQYQWVTHGKANGPDPEALGLKLWSNLYCSGDYIGRDLWQCPDESCRWDDAWQEGLPDDTRQKCLGYGGHTQYWSGKFTGVGKEIHYLISN